MRVRCLTNKVSAVLNTSPVAKRIRNFFGAGTEEIPLSPQKSYVVYALLESALGNWVYVADDVYPRIQYPVGYPLDFFSLEDGRRSKIWTSAVLVRLNEGEGSLSSFNEWTMTPDFYGRLLDEEAAAVALFRKRKDFMDLEYPNGVDFRSLVCFDLNWCQCPHCEHIWEDGTHAMGMKYCPQCRQILVDELWKGV